MEHSCRIVVIGAGIMGLTAALRLQERLPKNTPRGYITIVSSHLPGDESINYASPWAGAHSRAAPCITPSQLRAQKFERATWEVLRAQSQVYPEAGVKFMDALDYLEDPPEEYVKLQGGYSEAEQFRVLRQDELPPQVKFGSTYKAWCLSPPVYCAFLLRQFVVRGGNTMRMEVVSLMEAASLGPNIDVVVNCSGWGFGDADIFPIRGQTCLVSNPCDKSVTQQNKDGSWTFIIPRPLDGGTIIGGTKEPNDWSINPSEETRNLLLSQAAKMYPAILEPNSTFDVIRDIVGRRPTRKGGLRLSSERIYIPMTRQRDANAVRVVHAYGAGGEGYEISWGVAEEVANMVFEREP